MENLFEKLVEIEEKLDDLVYQHKENYKVYKDLSEVASTLNRLLTKLVKGEYND
jgi:hypothetical protein